MKKTLFCVISVWLIMSTVCSYAQTRFSEFSNQFVKGYKSLKIPGLQLSYADNLRAIQSAANIERQYVFFKGIQKGLNIFKREQLLPAEKTDYDLIGYETALNLERLDLEKQWKSSAADSISQTGLYHLPNGKKWYVYFLKRWVAVNVNPDSIFEFGLEQVKKVKQHIENIRISGGLSEPAFYKHLEDDSFFITNRSMVQERFEKIKQTVAKNLSNVFNVQQVPALSIEQGRDEAVAQTPGYYNSNTFYYNYFNKPYNKRQADWLFIHEAIPGHHYQSSIAARVTQSPVQSLFYYLGFSEGWAAYTEELGRQIGLYQTPYDELGKWEWDIVRSVRVPLDVALNYYGWSDEQALAFWKKNIYGQDDIAMREINRMKRWPAQVVTYKYGAAKIMAWRAILEKQEGLQFDIKAFHDKVLNGGSLPFFMIENKLFGKTLQ